MMKKTKQKVSKNMTFQEVVEKFPKASEILSKRGMHCLHCMMASMETLEQGCKAHGISDREIEEIIDEINAD